MTVVEAQFDRLINIEQFYQSSRSKTCTCSGDRKQWTQHRPHTWNAISAFGDFQSMTAEVIKRLIQYAIVATVVWSHSRLAAAAITVRIAYCIECRREVTANRRSRPPLCRLSVYTTTVRLLAISLFYGDGSADNFCMQLFGPLRSVLECFQCISSSLHLDRLLWTKSDRILWQHQRSLLEV